MSPGVVGCATRIGTTHAMNRAASGLATSTAIRDPASDTCSPNTLLD